MDKGYLVLLGLEYYVEKHKRGTTVRPKSKIYNDVEWLIQSLGVDVELVEGDSVPTELTLGERVAIPKVLTAADKKAMLAHLLTLQEVKHG